MNTKEEIFGLYAGSEYGVIFIDNYLNIKFNPLSVQFDEQTFNGVHRYSDCQIILKPLSKMSEWDCIGFVTQACGYKNAKEIKSVPADGGGWAEIRVTLEDDALILISMGVYDLPIFLWLIANGYALSDDWFKGDNPIAVEP